MRGNEKQSAVDLLRQQLEQMIEVARAEIEQAIAYATFTQHEDEGAEQIAALHDQLKTLDGHSSRIGSGSLIQLQQWQATLPRAISALRQSTSSLAMDASYHIGQHVTEMSMEKVHALQLAHNAESRAFMTYEKQSATHIDQIAAANGVDISGYRMNRARLQADIEDAKRNGDRPGQFRGEALLASNNIFGLVKAGGDETEIDEAKAYAAEARARYLKEKEIEALHAGKAQGLSGDALKAHVDLVSQTAGRELDAENARNAARAGLTPEQMLQANVVVAAAAEVDKETRNLLTEQDGQSSAFSIQAKHAPSVHISDRAAVAATLPDMKALLAANGIVPPAGGTGFETASADPAAPKQPAAAPDTALPAKDAALIQ